MGFELLNVKRSYRLPADDFVQDFLNPALMQASLYRRAVGFFTSKSLYQITVGLQELEKNNGRMQLIVSTKLSCDDVEAIELGYKQRERMIEQNLLKSFVEPCNEFEEERLNLICHLIETHVLDIKVAAPKSNSINAMYHEKLGILSDKKGISIAFAGSMNDSDNAYYENYESVDVYSDLVGEQLRVSDKKNDFDKMWNNMDEELYVVEFPKLVLEKLNQYKKDKVMINIDKKQFAKLITTKKIHKPDYIDIRPYQRLAIDAFKDNEYRGIFDMATGTGKTYTGLIAMSEMYNQLNEKLSIIICAPYKHLVTQWVEDLKEFGFNPIIAFSGSPQKKWRNNLKEAVFNYNYGNNKPFCLICVNNTFKSSFVQELLISVKNDMLLVIDEAHNFGSKGLASTLKDNYKYRLALSATLERHNDEEGTKKIYSYFGKKCIEYSLEDAIHNGYLTQYYYYPISIHLTENEQFLYDELTAKISKNIRYTKDGRVIRPFSKIVELLLLKRARIVAGASEKIPVLLNKMREYKDDSHILVYCGAANVTTGEEDEDGIRQIELVSKMLYGEYDMRVAHFTANENMYERKIIIDGFSEGDDIQAIAAIKCLDEGVNIPAIKTAFILASTTNPKEYIQRRGRVLRLYPGKEFATIYDFVTLPNDCTGNIRAAKSLIKRECTRIVEFSNAAINSRYATSLLLELEEKYENIGENNDEFI